MQHPNADANHAAHPSAEAEKNDAQSLIVASKVKNYVRAKSGMNTASAVTEAISQRVRKMCDHAIEQARRDGRKTVMERDFN